MKELKPYLQPSLIFLHPYFVMLKLKYSRIDRNPFPNFNNLMQPLRLLSNSVTNFPWSLVYVQHDLPLVYINKLVFKLGVACSSQVARVPAEALRIQVTGSAFFNRKQARVTQVPYNKVLTNLASSSLAGEYWLSVVFARTSLGSVRTATTSGQDSPVRPSRLVSIW